MIPARAYAAPAPRAPLVPYALERRAPGPRDVLIDISHCGLCHSDIHQVRDEWREGAYPMVPGHEIVGTVARVGAEVTRFAPGDRAGVGCFVDSCRRCASCRHGDEQHCLEHTSFTYNGTEQDRVTPTYGGYSQRIVVDQDYVLRLPPELAPERAAPLLCAGITTWAPLRRHGAGPGTRVAVVGLGGLGHMAVKLGVALGAEVTVVSSTPGKADSARALGAGGFLVGTPEALEAEKGRFDLVLDTVSAVLAVGPLLGLLRLGGTLALVGAPPQPLAVPAFALIGGRKQLVGSLIGGIRETQAMLDFCGARGVAADVEVIGATELERAYERMIRGDVRYRFVLDTGSLG